MGSRTQAAALWLGLVLLAGACTSPPAADPGSKGEIVIATDFPTSGADRAGGRGGEAGAEYAIQLNSTVKGFKVTHRPYDDAVNGVHDPQKAAQNFTDMVNDAKVLAVIGPFNSNVARATIPIANKAELVMISPSNTYECLTRDSLYCDPNPKPAALRDPSKPNNYFRIAAPDSTQGTAMADFAINTLKITKIAVWSDSLPFGKIVADSFTKRFQSKGGTVVVRQDFQSFTPVPQDFKPFLQRAKDAGAQGIYAGATTATAGCIPRAQSKGVLDVPYLGSDGIGDSQCIKDAGDQPTDAMYFTVAAPVAAQDPANKGLIDAFTKAFPLKEDSGTYAFPGYDSAKILLDAIGRAIDAAGGKMPTRRQVLDAVQNTKNLKLSTGTYSFDANGDASSPTMAFYQVKNGVWTFMRQSAVGP